MSIINYIENKTTKKKYDILQVIANGSSGTVFKVKSEEGLKLVLS